MKSNFSIEDDIVIDLEEKPKSFSNFFCKVISKIKIRVPIHFHIADSKYFIPLKYWSILHYDDIIWNFQK